jgi:TorA maturation chaperone TorD
MFSRLFLKPLDEPDIEKLAATNFIELAEDLKDVELLYTGFNDMGRDLRKRHTGTRQILSSDYTMCFDGVATVAGEVAVPYASVYLSEEALLNQEPRHAVFRLFRDENLALKSTVKLPEDHLSFELEFLAVLSDRTLAALEKGDLAEAVRNLQLSQVFIKEHIFTWLDLLTARANAILTTRFYKGALKAVKGYLQLDLITTRDLIEEIQNNGA